MSMPARTLKQVVFPLIVLGLLGAAYMARAKPGKAGIPEAFAAGVTLDDALARSERDGTPVFVFVTADWCGPCQVYKRGALSDARVLAALGASTIPVYVDVDRNTPMVERLGRMGLQIKGVPTTVLVEGGRITRTFSGGVSAEELLRWLKGA